MTILFRHYNSPADYDRIGQFLIEHYQPGNKDGNWLQPAWEYMHAHPFLDKSSLGKIGIWEESGMIMAVVHYESQLGEAFFQIHPNGGYLKAELLEYAEANLCAIARDGKRCLQVFINDFDPQFTALVQARGYEKDERGARPMFYWKIPDPFPAISLPEGFRLKSLAEDCDWKKVDRVLWRGFNHAVNPSNACRGQPPQDEIEDRKKMQDSPNFRHDLKIVVEAPNGDFASFCGMWYEPTCRYAYVEPVATDPDFRRMGLGKAVVLEGIRRCGKLGATLAYVGSDQLFYQAVGFKKSYASECWVKRFVDLNEGA